MEEKKCPECGKEVGLVEKCPECGYPLNSQIDCNTPLENEDLLLTKCKACGNIISKEADFCPQCGQKSDNIIENEKTENSFNIWMFLVYLIATIYFIYCFIKA